MQVECPKALLDTMRATNTKKAFIALISAIVISFTLLIAVVSVGARGLAGRFYLLDIDNKEASQALAEACVNVAFIAIANDASYSASNISVPVGSDTCTIKSVSVSGGQSTIQTSGIVKGATTNLEVKVNSLTVAVTSWEEKAN